METKSNSFEKALESHKELIAERYSDSSVMSSETTPNYYKKGAVSPNQYFESIVKGRNDLPAYGFYCLGQVIRYASRLGMKDDALKDAIKLADYANELVRILSESTETTSQ